jgi:hypothetical protein
MIFVVFLSPYRQIPGLFTKNSSWQAKDNTMTFYGECMKICEDFAPKFGDKGTGYCITAKRRFTLPFSPQNFLTRNNVTVVLHSPHFSVFPI